eukprot:CAMPEP_0194284354 /NCGR_PEP_ID=MMETSP0169-20130528/27437_1 /TAXON_ID=218684 /ORGANISM="Corethron pennatum, Strain L29A3" /LENGTH=540 /DNA_ID=CAMNT_0039030155 /DNA_START=85 /DNA_END=1707 /DNA_ORIENTATION=-
MNATSFIFVMMIDILPIATLAFALPSTPVSSSVSKATVGPRWKFGRALQKSSCQVKITSPTVSAVLSIPRAGDLSLRSTIVSAVAGNPATLFDSMLAVLAIFAVATKATDRLGKTKSPSLDEDKFATETSKPPEVKSLQRKYLIAFWLLRCGYWMSGPYVVPAYRSKIFGGVEASMGLISKIFLSGFAATAILGPSIGQATDTYGRKAGTIMFSLLYAIGCASIKSNTLWVLFAGRAIIGCALSLLFTAPEAWVNGEASRTDLTPYLGETFGLAYTGDALVAVLAGKLASWAAAFGGVTAPFDLATIFLLAGGIMAGVTWKENKAKATEKKSTGGGNMMEALEILRKDKRLQLIGAVQSLFEASMNIFILQWPPIVSRTVSAAFGDGAVTPFGTIFSCFMTSSLLGSLWFGKSMKSNSLTETTAVRMLAVSTISMALAAFSVERASLAGVMVAMLAFEACVGVYFPAIGTLRSKLIPNDKKSLILNLFGVPLNALVVISYLFITKLGMSGSLLVSAGALAVATVCMMKLCSIAKKEAVGA